MVGESGSGKTVTCLSIIQLVAARKAFISEGSIRFEGRELIGASERALREIRGKDIGIVFQEPMTSLDPVLTIGKQLDVNAQGAHGPFRAQRRARCVELLHLVGIPEPEKRLKSYPFEISGGMKQRVMIAMALSCEPKLLIADEPTTGADVTIQAQILQLLRNCATNWRCPSYWSSHDLGVVANFAERVVVMYAGKVVEEGPTSQDIAHPLHPYTQGLIASIPRMTQPRDRALNVIPGNIPDLGDMPAGCRFAPRCGCARPECERSMPENAPGGARTQRPLLSAGKGGKRQWLREIYWCGSTMWSSTSPSAAACCSTRWTASRP